MRHAVIYVWVSVVLERRQSFNVFLLTHLLSFISPIPTAGEYEEGRGMGVQVCWAALLPLPLLLVSPAATCEQSVAGIGEGLSCVLVAGGGVRRRLSRWPVLLLRARTAAGEWRPLWGPPWRILLSGFGLGSALCEWRESSHGVRGRRVCAIALHAKRIKERAGTYTNKERDSVGNK